MKSIRRNLAENAKKLMPAAGGCSNCYSKYSLLNREEGCSNCALSFCKKCVSYKAHLPHLASAPLSVCYNCYQKIEDAKIKPSKAPPPVKSTPSTNCNPSTSKPANWWGEGLPPPSMRQDYAKKPTRPKPPANLKVEKEPEVVPEDRDNKDLHQRLEELKKDDSKQPPPSIEEIENRLAALRGCDVEIIRNPRLWFANKDGEQPTKQPQTVQDLMEQARDLAAIEDSDMNYLEQRAAKLRQKEPTPGDEKTEEAADKTQENGADPDDPRMSVVSEPLDPQEQEAYEKMMQEAEERSKQIAAEEKAVDTELQQVLAITRRKSQDANQVNDQFTKFWDKQINKTIEHLSDSEEDNVDDEMVKKIVKEVEAMPDDVDDQQQQQQTSHQQQQQQKSPKKGFFSRFLKK